MPKDQLNDAVVVAYFSWENSVSRVAAVDPQTGTVVLTGKPPWPFLTLWGPHQRYHIENVKAALDAPGEWFLDRGGDLFYIPLPGEDMTKAEVVAPVLAAWCGLRAIRRPGGSSSTSRCEGLSFQHDRCPLPRPGLQQRPGGGRDAGGDHGRRRPARDHRGLRSGPYRRLCDPLPPRLPGLPRRSTV